MGELHPRVLLRKLWDMLAKPCGKGCVNPPCQWLKRGLWSPRAVRQLWGYSTRFTQRQTSLEGKCIDFTRRLPTKGKRILCPRFYFVLFYAHADSEWTPSMCVISHKCWVREIPFSKRMGSWIKAPNPLCRVKVIQAAAVSGHANKSALVYSYFHSTVVLL